MSISSILLFLIFFYNLLLLFFFLLLWALEKKKKKKIEKAVCSLSYGRSNSTAGISLKDVVDLSKKKKKKKKKIRQRKSSFTLWECGLCTLRMEITKKKKKTRNQNPLRKRTKQKKY